MRTLILYGAGKNAVKELENVRKAGYSPVSFCDADPDKQGTNYLGLPVNSLETIKEAYGDFFLWVTLASENKYNAFDYLIRQGIWTEQILNYEEYSRYEGCSLLETQLVVDQNSLFHCCYVGETRNDPPKLQWREQIEDTVNAFLESRNQLIKQIKHGEVEKTPCAGCPSIKEGAYSDVKGISSLSFGFDSPCNLACYYCVHRNAVNKISVEAESQIRSFAWKEFIRCLEQKGQLAESSTITLAAGELTCDPRKKDILDTVEQYHLAILTNAVLYDDRIAALIARPGSSSTVSVDAGTKETYRKVKGLDAFERVFANLRKYASQGSNLTLKYIFLPENCNTENVEGFIQNTVTCGVKNIYISDNIFRTKPHSDEDMEQMAKMVTLARKNDIQVILGDEIGEDKQRLIQYL
ncbi:putative Radical SAM domain protein [uncultured Sporomusa sp.]|uniref:Putative Radical SAM domain protein n=1 Tax=uncultured Sporomusa sp. TaxID=307249 RepID=A0A212M1N8_9FIRM|nr:radical SAM protein [uncultured Sporomusa sp.]SCM83667.1 putative Radical SAM domain protein [uncultured Sporomusa sp.]